MWLNDNAGIVVLVLGVLMLAMLAVLLWLVFSLRSRFAVQRLKFVGLYSADVVTRRVYAALTVGNRSVSEIAIREIGIKNGGVAFDLTRLYREKAGLDERTRIVVEQRHALSFDLSVGELSGVLVDGKNGRQLKTLRLYAVDLTGNLYEGKIPAVRRLLAAVRKGALPAAASSAPTMSAIAASADAPLPPAAASGQGEKDAKKPDDDAPAPDRSDAFADKADEE